ncbi:hypothetical protein [Peribacillus asahii]|uniref:hypothetical protein n=1 Tax=Peribacillus asahii TaxID=228899 RepID=UPI00207A78CC|nr:hypothetical protein [Peribacillus asahii]USK62296.1 hypothetical protein LIT37_24290 [Peribacillus asahii]
MSKMIDFGYGRMPEGFSRRLSSYFNLVSIDIYATPDFTGGTIIEFSSEDDYVLVKPKGMHHVNYRPLGRYELLNAIFSKGDYYHSFFIAKNIFNDPTGRPVKLIALLYEDRNKIHFWNPTFEELFVPLIRDDLDKGTDSHWRNLQEIHEQGDPELNVHDIALQSNVDYEIEGYNNMYFTTCVYYALINHILLVETEKFPDIPGADRTLKAYKDLYDEYRSGNKDLDNWRRKYNLRNHWL